MKRRSFKILWGLVLAAGMLLSPFADIRAEDGLEKGYTYNYDYWEEIQYSPDANSERTWTGKKFKFPAGNVCTGKKDLDL